MEFGEFPSNNLKRAPSVPEGDNREFLADDDRRRRRDRRPRRSGHENHVSPLARSFALLSILRRQEEFSFSFFRASGRGNPRASRLDARPLCPITLPITNTSSQLFFFLSFLAGGLSPHEQRRSHITSAIPLDMSCKSTAAAAESAAARAGDSLARDANVKAAEQYCPRKREGAEGGRTVTTTKLRRARGSPLSPFLAI